EKHLELQRLYGWIEEQNAQLQEEATRRANVEAALQRARDELLVLYEVSAVTSQDLPLKTMLDQALSKAMQAIPSEHGAILLPVEKEAESQPDALRLMTQQGTLGEVMPPREALFPGGGLMGWLHQEREPLLIPDLSVEMRVHPAMRQIGSKAMLATPLRAEGRVLGIMGLIRAKDRGFNLEEIALLASVGDQIGVAVQRDRLRQRAWQANVLEERQRLSRNLHDSVTQSLYGLVTLTEAGQEHLEKGALERAGEMFDRLGTVARQALKEMRLFIFELHPPALEEAGLAAALQMRLDAVEGRSGVQARIAGDDVDIHLPQPVEETLYYIAQEALNNILKHAGDCSASISLHAEGEKLVIEIADNGCGFDPQAAPAGVGLRNMRERAAEIGAALEVRSAPGEGVRVRVVVEVGELVSAGSERRHVVEGLS
ncbi:MAG: GAF domain-containing protein, partial [Anaerolineales bacterium]